MAASKLTTQLIEGPHENEYFRYMMDKPIDLITEGASPFKLDVDVPLMLDVETHSTSYEDIRTVQLFQAHWPKVCEFDTNDVSVTEIYDVIKNCHVVAHMLTMEVSCFQNDLKPVNVSWKDYKPRNPFSRYSDTFLIARQALYNKVEGFSLDKVAAYVHGVDYYADYARALGWADPSSYKKYMQKSFLNTPKSDKRNQALHEEQLIYAALDVMVMPKIYNTLRAEEKKFILKLDYLFIDRCSEYQHHGLPLDLEAWERHMTKQLSIMEESTNILPEGLNPRSYLQVRKMLNSSQSDDAYLAQVEDGSDLVVCPVGVSGADENGLTEASDLYMDEPETFQYRKELAKALRDFRSAVKRTEYLKAYKKQYERFGVVKGYISPRTISGRIAGDEINMTNIPRSLKDLFGYPNKDGWLTYADFSQLELRMLACVLKEEVMIDKYMNDEDLHVYAATQIYEKAPSEISYAERFIGKFFNFSGSYGAGVARLCSMLIKQAGMYMSEENMRPLHRKWKNTFPALSAWHRANGRSKTNEDVTLLGRWYKAKMYTDLNAIKMQGSAAEVFKLAHLYMAKNKPDIRTGAAVHDSYVHLDKEFEEAKLTAKVTVWSMVVAWFEVIANSQYPQLKMPTDGFVGRNWGEIEDDKYDYCYKVAGTYEQYQAIRNYITRGTLLENLDILPEIEKIGSSDA